MAYGVKFRLEFDDDNQKTKKIEILKDGYTGSVLSLIGSGEPVVVTWDGNDDFYEPIIGSTCAINLLVTDDTNYDDFYTADEREYKVKISYKDSGDTYQTYWEGWLLVDQFREAVTTTPYPITLKAYDGLGSLGGFTMPIDLTSTAAKSLMYYIHNILGNLNLGFDIYISNDIQLDNPASGTYTIYDQSSVSTDRLLKGAVDLRDSKDVLSQILRFTNARIFQSYGKWYIINNSSYSEQSVKDASATTANGGALPTGIRADETEALQDTGEEDIKFFIYNSSGVYQSTSTVDVLYVLGGVTTTLSKTNCSSNCNIPVTLYPVNNNMEKEYLRPLKEYIIEVDTDDNFFDTDKVTNGGFEHGSTGWTLTNSTIDTDFTFKGDRSVKTTNVQTSSGGTSVTLVNSSAINTAGNPNIAFKLIINNYFDSTASYDRGFRFQVYADSFVLPGDPAVADLYWSESTNEWVTTATINDQEVDTNRRWKKYTYNIDSLPTTATWNIYLRFYDPYQETSTSGFTAMYFDTIKFESENIDSAGNRSEIFAKFDLLKYIRKRTVDLSGVKTSDGYYLSNEKYSNISGDYFRSRDKTNYLKSIEEITSQQVMNDYRDYVVRYEGDVYNNIEAPLSPHNKVWINFGTSVLQEPVSCYIDSLEYNMKRNTYKVVMHIPNQDDDESSDFVIRF